MNTNTAISKRAEQVEARPTITPRVDIVENDAEMLLLADLPGVTEQGLTVHLDDGELSISGRWSEEPAGAVLAREFQATDYARSFILPAGIDATRISAELKAGVLRLHLPKSDAVRPRRIEVKAG
jgi:HSP20 family protein